jgi:hypothetical protein
MTDKQLQALIMAFKEYAPQDIVTDKDEQNILLKEVLIKKGLVEPVAFIHSNLQAAPVTLYFPASTQQLLQANSQEQVGTLDVLYALLNKRRFVLLVEALDEDLRNVLFDQGIDRDAALTVFADDYATLADASKKLIRIIDPMEFIKKELN